MIKRIKKLKNFGIYHDFNWGDNALKDFSNFNLIYGWNRNGKTTLSRVFESCEKKCTLDASKFEQYPDHGEFEIITSDGRTISNLNVENADLQIKVFNQDFIAENISFEPSKSCNPIVYISQVDIKKKNELKQLKSQTQQLQNSLELELKNHSNKVDIKNTFLTSLAGEIHKIYIDRGYNRTRLESRIKDRGISFFYDKRLSNEDFKKYDLISKSNSGDTKSLTLFPPYAFNLNICNKTINDFHKIYDLVKNILEKKIISETLDRLKNDMALSNWVKQGFDLQKSRNDLAKCLFCQNDLSDDFLLNLSKHFSTDYDDLQNLISELKQNLINLKRKEIQDIGNDLYPDLKDAYLAQLKELNILILKMNSWIDIVVMKLEEKYNNPLEIVSAPEEPESFLVECNIIVGKLNEIINDHGNKAENHSAEVISAKEKLEYNAIAIALSEQDYKTFEAEINEAKKLVDDAQKAFGDNKSKIIELESETSNINDAISKINQHLREFFGRKEIQLIPAADHQGYLIEREGRPAKNLSESEKTAIAFSYFVVKAEEIDIKISDSIIFIDDPISSFDSNSIYHCFSLIKKHFRYAKQLFISTHNFQFFNLVKKWFKGKNENIRKNNLKKEAKNQKEEDSKFYMVKSSMVGDDRTSCLSMLESTLEKFRSEYNFLFSILSSFIDEENNSYEDLYIVGNIARRFFDIFADFKIPAPETLGQKAKLEMIVTEINKGKETNIISEEELDKVFLLTNGFSHNDDPLSAVEHIDRSECITAIKNLIKIIGYSDPLHFKHLSDSVEKDLNKREMILA